MTAHPATRTDAGTEAGDQAGADHSDADIVDRLFTELGSRVPLPVITAVVREGRTQLSCSPEEAMPELLERLARHRLTAGPGPGPGPG